MRKILMLIASLAAAEAAAAETRYVVVLHVLKTTGEYSEMVLPVTRKGGVGYIECDMRKNAYLAKHEKGWEIALAQVASEGLHAEVTITCEPVSMQ